MPTSLGESSSYPFNGDDASTQANDGSPGETLDSMAGVDIQTMDGVTALEDMAV